MLWLDKQATFLLQKCASLGKKSIYTVSECTTLHFIISRKHNALLQIHSFVLVCYRPFSHYGDLAGWQNSPTRTWKLQLRWECIVFQRDELCTNHEILHTYLPFYIWSWYIYEMKVHIKYIYYYKFETKLLLITNKNYENWVSQSSFTWRSMEGDCYVYAHSSLWMCPTRPERYNAKMVYSLLPGPRNFVDACVLQFHMFPTIWSYTTTIGLLDLTSGSVQKWRLQWRNSGSPIERSVAHGKLIDAPRYASPWQQRKRHQVRGVLRERSNAQCSKIKKWLHSRCFGIKKAQSLPLLLYSLLLHI